jgi:hypothetical protein
MKYIAAAAVLGALIATPSFGALSNTDLPEPEASSGATVEWKSHGLDIAGLARSIPGAPDISVFILHADR